VKRLIKFVPIVWCLGTVRADDMTLDITSGLLGQQSTQQSGVDAFTKPPTKAGEEKKPQESLKPSKPNVVEAVDEDVDEQGEFSSHRAAMPARPKPKPISKSHEAAASANHEADDMNRRFPIAAMLTRKPLQVSDLDFIGVQAVNGYEVIGELQSEFRNVLGEENFASLGDTYLEVKQFDAWLEATLESYDLPGQLQGVGAILGLNSEFAASLLFGPEGGDSGGVYQPLTSQTVNPLNDFETLGLKRGDSTIDDELVRDSIFRWIFELFKLSNILVVGVAVFVCYCIVKVIRIVFKQRKLDDSSTM